jgi:hypothetical protein
MDRRRFIGAAFAGIGATCTSTTFARRRPQIQGGRLRVGSRKYPTIDSIYAVAEPGMTVEVLPGTYNEPIFLLDGVNWAFHHGAVVHLDSFESNLSVISDDGQPVTCAITGSGVFHRSNGGSACHVLRISGHSNLTLLCNELRSSVENISSEAVYLLEGSTHIVGNISSDHSIAVRTNWQSDMASVVGDVHSGVDYGVLAGGGQVELRGNMTSSGNAAVHCSSGSLSFQGTAVSEALFGFEMSGGSARLTHALCRSNRDVQWESDAISKYGGEDLILDNCQLCCLRSDAFSLGSQGSEQTVDIVNELRVNRPIAPSVATRGGTVIDAGDGC